MLNQSEWAYSYWTENKSFPEQQSHTKWTNKTVCKVLVALAEKIPNGPHGSDWDAWLADENLQAHLQTALPFITREEYLAWVVDWKAEYKRVSICGPEWDWAPRRKYARVMLYLRYLGKVTSWAYKMQALQAAKEPANL